MSEITVHNEAEVTEVVEVAPTIRERLKTVRKSNKRRVKAFEFDFIKPMPPSYRAKWDKAPLKDKLFMVYFFHTDTVTEAAILAGYSRKSPQIGYNKKKQYLVLLQWLEDQLVRQVSDRIFADNIVSREMIVEKLARMMLPNIGDVENYEDAKRKGLLDCVKKVGHIVRYDEDGEEYTERVVLEMHDQHKPMQTLIKMLGYEAPTKTEIIGGSNNGANLPQINLQINLVQSDQVK